MDIVARIYQEIGAIVTPESGDEPVEIRLNERWLELENTLNAAIRSKKAFWGVDGEACEITPKLTELELETLRQIIELRSNSQLFVLILRPKT